MLIAQRLDISFGGYLVYALVPALLALVVVWAVLALAYRGRWILDHGDAPQPDAVPEPSLDTWETTKGLLILGFILYAFVFTEWDRGMVATVAGVLMLFNARFMSRTMLERVDWDLLILFVGLFIVNGAFAKAGLATQLVAWLGGMGIDLHDADVLFAVSAVRSPLKIKDPFPVVHYADHNPALLPGLVVEGLGEGADLGVLQHLPVAGRVAEGSKRSASNH